jgi:hypothetical protein
MSAEKAPVRRCITPAQGQPMIISSFPIFKLFSISVNTETGTLAEVKRAFHLPGGGTTWEGRLMRAAGVLSHFKNT